MNRHITRMELQDIADAVNGEIRTDYQGRGGTGPCLAITFDEGFGGLVQMGYVIAEVFGTDSDGYDRDTDDDEVERGQLFSQGAQVDQMGFSHIVYWPRWSVAL